jgi:pimeloyl-ACP methyl ester carboxylesterase
MRVTGAGGVGLAVRVSGDPSLPTLVCVHGYPDDSSLWDGVTEQLRDQFHIVAYDLRGFGGSDRPRKRRDYRLDVLEADFTAVIDAVSPDEPVHLLAHDWGSIQGWHFVTSQRLAGRVATFTSISGPCLDHAGHRMRNRSASPGPTLRSWHVMLMQIPLLPELLMHTFGRLFLARLRRTGPRSTLPSSTSIQDYLHGIQLYRANLLPRLLRPQVRRTSIPVQVISPTRDRFVSKRLQQEVGQWAPDLHLETVHSGHWLPRTHAGELAELVARHTARFAVS